MQDVFRAQEKALSSCGRDLGHEPRVAVDKTELGGGPGWQDLGCPSRMLGACAPWGPSLLSSGGSPTGKPGNRGYCDLSQLSGQAQQHHHGYPGQHRQAVVFGPAGKGATSYKGMYVSTPSSVPPLPHSLSEHGRGSLGSLPECVL